MADYFELNENAKESAYQYWYETHYLGNSKLGTDEVGIEFALWIEEEQPEFNDDGSRIEVGKSNKSDYFLIEQLEAYKSGSGKTTDEMVEYIKELCSSHGS